MRAIIPAPAAPLRMECTVEIGSQFKLRIITTTPKIKSDVDFMFAIEQVYGS